MLFLSLGGLLTACQFLKISIHEDGNFGRWVRNAASGGDRDKTEADD